jgi:hypothetical protein
MIAGAIVGLLQLLSEVALLNAGSDERSKIDAPAYLT